jgi:hypothetical protein
MENHSLRVTGYAGHSVSSGIFDFYGLRLFKKLISNLFLLLLGLSILHYQLFWSLQFE